MRTEPTSNAAGTQPATAPRPRTGARGSWVVAGLSAGLVIMWSSGFVGGRLGTQDASALSLLSWRFLVLAPLVAAVLLVLARTRRLAVRAWPRQALLGVLSQVVYLGGVIGAIELGVGAGTSALVAALQPLLTGALTGPLLGQRTSARRWAGLGIGFTGVAIVVGGDLSTGSSPAWAYLLPFAGMLGLTAATLMEAASPSRVPMVEGLGVQCLTSTVVFTAAAGITGTLTGPFLAEGTFWLAVAWVIVLSTFGGYGFYWLTLRHTDATRVGTLMYLSAPTTAVWAWLMFGDPIRLTALLGFAVCLIGVAAVFLSRGRAWR